MLKYRRANLNDIEKMVELRKKQLVDEGLEASIDIDKELSVFFKDKLSEGRLIQWLVEDDDEIDEEDEEEELEEEEEDK